jgi:uncharacterized membrane protein YeaQ/YmgE (transglycosylase-associated protein family)
MGILMWTIIGMVIGVLTLLIEPYVNRRHIPVTLIMGVIGALIGGVFATFLGFANVEGMRFMIIVVAIIGAVLLLTLYRGVEHY